MVYNTLPISPAPKTVVTGESRRKSWLLALAAIIAGTAVLCRQAAYYENWIVDDAAITFAYARSFTDGLGPVAHPGATPVEAFSNPTWMALLGVGRLFGLFDHGTLFGVPDYVLFPKGLAALCCAGILAACYSVARKVTDYAATVTFLTAVVLATIPSFVIWSFSGLENSLFALTAVTLAAVLFRALIDGRLATRKVAVVAGLIVAFAALTRPDGLIYVAAYPLVLLIHSRRLMTSLRFSLVSLAAFAVPFGSYLTWRFLKFGLLVPNTAVAKQQGLPTFGSLIRIGQLAEYVGLPVVAVFLLLVIVAFGQPAWLRGGLVALVVPLTLSIAAFGVLEVDWMAQYRFATPIWALSALAGTLVTAKALAHLATRSRIALVIALVAVMIPSGVGFAAASQKFHDEPTFHMCFVADRFGREFNHYADLLDLKDGSLLLPDIGGTSMTTRLRVIDMAGLADTRIGQYTRDNDKAGLRDYVFGTVKPTFVTSHGIWNPGTGIALDPRLPLDYYEIYNDGHGSTDWVRKDVVPDMTKLQAARDYGAATIPEIFRKAHDEPRRQCGPTLRLGQS
jgi:hypothetical protein